MPRPKKSETYKYASFRAPRTLIEDMHRLAQRDTDFIGSRVYFSDLVRRALGAYIKKRREHLE